MNEVEAVKNRDTIKLISYLLERHFGQQMADVWNIGLNLALRISDLLAIKFSDIDGDRLNIIEQKTGKRASIKLNPKTLALIEAIHQRHPEHIYLFQSHRSSQVKDQQAPAKPLTRRAVAKAFAFVGDDIKLALGTHSMRKTRGVSPVSSLQRHWSGDAHAAASVRSGHPALYRHYSAANR